MDVYLEYKSNISRALFVQIPARLNRLARGYSARHRARMGNQGTRDVRLAYSGSCMAFGEFPMHAPNSPVRNQRSYLQRERTQKKRWWYRIICNTTLLARVLLS